MIMMTDVYSVFPMCQNLSFKGLAPIDGCYILEDFSPVSLKSFKSLELSSKRIGCIIHNKPLFLKTSAYDEVESTSGFVTEIALCQLRSQDGCLPECPPSLHLLLKGQRVSQSHPVTQWFSQSQNLQLPLLFPLPPSRVGLVISDVPDGKIEEGPSTTFLEGEWSSVQTVIP